MGRSGPPARKLASIAVETGEGGRATARLKGVPLQYANALRRICLNGIMVFAIDTVDVVSNTSSLPDEALAHRLGLVPLRTDLSEFQNLRAIDVNESSNRVLLVLDEEADETRTVLSGDLSSQDPYVKPATGRIPIVQLAPGQVVKAEAYARLGRGTEHAKWNSANIAVLTEGDAEGEHVLTVESTGALEPAVILSAAIDELQGRLEDFRDVVGGLKAAPAA
ncbi:MAG: DNA-directed RNA polymerase subunit D [Thaumarchaeota archaeon S15]|nr:MAG: DNA-directed RNA polymerase subunit D [Thaumarchaeota archaeon S14]RNJ73139.1 MAG: DNA-directed RNA polymerase subunit D [Thaumarchaeota archaeon S13]RNJ73273.1 MAG: DNA-directed RNA polymerase subunit D [Thaumarchaeota archaeon S15]